MSNMKQKSWNFTPVFDRKGGSHNYHATDHTGTPVPRSTYKKHFQKTYHELIAENSDYEKQLKDLNAKRQGATFRQNGMAMTTGNQTSTLSPQKPMLNTNRVMHQ
jgi:hypothetical protein